MSITSTTPSSNRRKSLTGVRERERETQERATTTTMKVLVAVDDSDGSRHALAWVLDHLFPAAEQPHQEEPAPALVLVHAQEPLRHVMMYPVGPGDSTSPQY